MFSDIMTRHADVHWHRELDHRVISTDHERTETMDDEWDSLIKSKFGGVPLVQAYILKQMAVSPHAKYADWRYNKYSPDFNETKSQQDQRYWKYLHPILLDLKSSRLRTSGLNSLFHFKETESPTALSLYTLAERMEKYMTRILTNNFISSWTPEGINHLQRTRCFDDRYERHPQFINVDNPCTSPPGCNYCLEEKRELSSEARIIIGKLRELFARARKLARNLAVNSLQRMMPNLPMDVILLIWHNYLGCPLDAIAIFKDLTQKECLWTCIITLMLLLFVLHV